MVENCNRIDAVLLKKRLTDYIKATGTDVRLNTKARGHHGFCTGKRIDVSKNLSDEKTVEVLIHEFAHYSHFLLEPALIRTGGNLSVLFDMPDIDGLKVELRAVTELVYDMRPLEKITALKCSNDEEVRILRTAVKAVYPDFKSSEKFPPFIKYARKSNARWLLKYDVVKIPGFLFFQPKLISVKTLDDDFPGMPEVFKNYLRLKSAQRRGRRLSSRIRAINSYLDKPGELFARFVQAYVLYPERTRSLAPRASAIFEKLLSTDFYPGLKNFLELCDGFTFE